MNNNLIKKETGFIKRIKDWIKSKFEKTFENGKKVMEITEENEQQSNITIPPDTQLEIDDNSALISDLPSYFPFEHVDKDWEKKIEKAKKVLYKKLAKYGITKDEWEEIEKRKSNSYKYQYIPGDEQYLDDYTIAILNQIYFNYLKIN